MIFESRPAAGSQPVDVNPCRSSVSGAEGEQRRPRSAGYPPKPSGFAAGDRRLCLWIWSLTLAVFLISPVTQVLDSRFSLLLTETLLHHRTFDLRRHVPQDIASAVDSRMNSLRRSTSYELLRVNNTIVYAYPLGGSILSIPFVAALNLCGLSNIGAHGQYRAGAEDAMQRIIASLLMATLAAIFYRMARLRLPQRWSAAIALGAAFGTPLWSTLSRALWGQTWAVFLTGYLAYRLLEDDTKTRPANGATLATLASWAFFARPTGAIAVIGVTAYLALHRRALLAQWLAAGLFWLACFLALSWKVYGVLIPPYYQGETLRSGPIAGAIAAILFSPSRGLFVFVPTSLWILSLALWRFPVLRQRALASLALGIWLVYLPLIASDVKWWGGYSYGPRLMADLIPWLVLLAVLACEVQLRSRPVPSSGTAVSMSSAVTVLGAIALAISIVMNAPGALYDATMLWNIAPADLDKHPERVWDWKHPQFLAWAEPDTTKTSIAGGLKK